MTARDEEVMGRPLRDAKVEKSVLRGSRRSFSAVSDACMTADVRSVSSTRRTTSIEMPSCALSVGGDVAAGFSV